MDSHNFFDNARSDGYSPRPVYTSYPSFPSYAFSPPRRPRHVPSYSSPSPPAKPFSHPPTPPSSDAARSSPPAETDPSRPAAAPSLTPHAREAPPELTTLTPSFLTAHLATRHTSLLLERISPGMLEDWESEHPSLRESDSLRYEYDSVRERLVVKCMPSPLHDSVQGFFVKRVCAALDRLGDGALDALDVNCGTDFQGFSPPYTHATRKQPDFYILPAGAAFPSVVLETGWTQPLSSLLSDARLWLLGTSGAVKVVLLVSFTEARLPALADPPITPSTTVHELAAAMLADGTPLLGELAAELRVLRRVEGEVVCAFVATVLPRGEGEFEIGVREMGGLGYEGAKVAFKVAAMREAVLRQVPRMRRHRAIARAEGVMRRAGRGGVTYAAGKRAGEGGEAEVWV